MCDDRFFSFLYRPSPSFLSFTESVCKDEQLEQRVCVGGRGLWEGSQLVRVSNVRVCVLAERRGWVT